MKKINDFKKEDQKKIISFCDENDVFYQNSIFLEINEIKSGGSDPNHFPKIDIDGIDYFILEN